MPSLRRFGLFVLMLALWPITAGAQSIHNLEQNLPLEIQDTSPTDTGKISLQASMVTERSDTSPDQLTLEPNVQWGFAENAHLFVYSPYYIGHGDATSGSGDIFVGMLWNFWAEGQYSPSIAIVGELVAPTGVGSDGLDTAVTLIATKQITKESSEDRLHLNIRWDHNSIPGIDERGDRFEYVFGYSRKLSEKSVLVLDYFHRQELSEGQESNMAEIGMLFQLSQQVVLGAGIGAGLDDESPDLRLSLALQWNIGS
jgi:hypothetical protein